MWVPYETACPVPCAQMALVPCGRFLGADAITPTDRSLTPCQQGQGWPDAHLSLSLDSRALLRALSLKGRVGTPCPGLEGLEEVCTPWKPGDTRLSSRNSS